MIVDLAGPMLMERDDPELKAIFNSHSDTDFDQVETVLDDEMKSIVEDVFGIEAGTLDEVMEAAEEEVLENARQREAEREAERETERQARPRRARTTSRRSSARSTRDARKMRSASSQSIRDVYRRLASALHPDRETDPDEAKRKTALMQRVNAAYASNNLLQLLELQLELEHIDQAALDNISEERLQHYNQILKQQLAELARRNSSRRDGFQGAIRPAAVGQRSPRKPSSGSSVHTSRRPARNRSLSVRPPHLRQPEGPEAVPGAQTA